MANTQCPSPLLISQFIDHELTYSEETTLRAHVASCELCTSQIDHFQQIENRMRTESRRASFESFEAPHTSECLSPTTVTDYVSDALPGNIASNVENHLSTCDSCFTEVQEASQLVYALASQTNAPVPVALKARVAATWEPSLATQMAMSLSRFVIQVSRQGLELIEQHIVAPLLEAQQVLVPTAAYRADQVPQALDLKIRSGEAEIQATAFHEGDGVSLQMILVSNTHEILTGQRVFLRQNGRSIFSARTDSEGSVRTPHLQPGIYEVTCASVDATFQLDLRA